jgi:hypothetical protein
MTRDLDREVSKLAGRFPLWLFWRGPSGMLYARPADAGAADEPLSDTSADELAGKIRAAGGTERR